MDKMSWRKKILESQKNYSLEFSFEFIAENYSEVKNLNSIDTE